ncbi:MAG: ABC transporter ATP-binding protein [Euryarchaeota archaeon]|nr:ABC transporter ATP-binding protein [Euryarchaeota archaeon]MDE1835169.1 ABC transporter ATP-binding protein [Euryarchaeota archaeon]MDE1880420.1 ABC transporter ATP-binding protein [Euryarchaeota archaeon]MDE2045711.1 ABC transporter ATP-binding protein [Thermoplasmata archaeon]
MSEPAILVQQVRRVYQSRKGFLFQEKVRTEALKGVDLEVAPGELFGLLGPNGAGKTTLVKILSTLLLPTSGTAKVLGVDVAKEPRRLRPRIGLVLGGERGLYNRISARENLRYFADLYGVPAGRQAERIRSVLDTVGLAEAADRRVEEFSRGMKQKLHLARGILHEPELLFLDEPTIGLDPKSARDMRQLIREQVAGGVTVLLTSHYMFEAEELCHRIAVLSKGKIVARDTVAGLRRLVGGDRTLEVEGYGFEDLELEKLRRLSGVSRIVTEEFGPKQRLTLRVPTGDLALEEVRSALGSRAELEIRERRTTLEDVYLDLVEEEAS